MRNEELIEKVKNVIQVSTETDLEISEETALYEDMGLASIEVYVLLSDLEEAFNIAIPAAELRKVRTVRDLCQVVSGIINE